MGIPAQLLSGNNGEHSETTGNTWDREGEGKRELKKLFGKDVLPENESICDKRKGILNVMFAFRKSPQTTW